MASLKNIKKKILTYKKTGTVTHAMEAVSAVKMRKAQERALGGRAYAAAALSVLERLSGTVEIARHPLMNIVVKAGPLRAKTCFIVITSDKGLAGSLNSAVIRRVEADIASHELDKKDVIIVAMGRRGGDHFLNRGYEVRIKLENVSDDVSEAQMREVTNKLIEWHKNAEIRTVTVAYTNFVSTFEQEAIVRQIVPITPVLMAEVIAGIRPARGKYAPSAADAKAGKPAAYTIEPDADTVLAVLLPTLLNISVFHAMLESKASEHSARMVAMKSATDKAKDMVKSYTRTFNKIRQAAITAEVSEITSGMEAMR